MKLMALLKRYSLKISKRFFFSLNSYYKTKEAESRRANLLARRERLKQLLSSDQAMYDREIEAMATTRGPGIAITDLRAAREAMRQEREQEMKKEAEEKMLQHWKLNNPEFREVILCLQTI